MADAARAGRRLGIDVGSVRVGVALSDPSGVLATPLTTIPRDVAGGTDLQAIAGLVVEHEVVEVVIGLPRTLANTEGPAAVAARAFADALAAVLAVPIRADRRAVDHRGGHPAAAAARGARAAAAGGGGPGRRGGDPAGLAGRRPAIDRVTRGCPVLPATRVLVTLRTCDAVCRGTRGRDWAWFGTSGRGGAMIDDETVQLPAAAGGVAVVGIAGGRRGRRLAVLLLAVLLLLGAVVGGGLYLYTSTFTPDFDGPGTGDVVIQVQDGDSTRQIGRVLTEQGVVASPLAFINAAEADGDRARSIQPGYYHLRSQMSGAAAVALLLDPASRVGQLEIRGGVQLDDTRAPDGSVVPGVLTLISQATCMTVDGGRRCVSADELRAAMSEHRPGAAGRAVLGAGRRGQGRSAAAPGGSAGARAATTCSRACRPRTCCMGCWRPRPPGWRPAGWWPARRASAATPYQVLTIASLVEKEAINPDMAKVARVVYNRLGAGRRLELDSTVNYPLDLQALRTTRSRPGNSPSAYNSYQLAGLPPTPIAAPGGRRSPPRWPPSRPVAVLRALPDRRHLLLRHDLRRARRERGPGQGERGLLGRPAPRGQQRCSARKARVRCQARSAGCLR